jgi:hypothetical protein
MWMPLFAVRELVTRFKGMSMREGHCNKAMALSLVGLSCGSLGMHS